MVVVVEVGFEPSPHPKSRMFTWVNAVILIVVAMDPFFFYFISVLLVVVRVIDL